MHWSFKWNEGNEILQDPAWNSEWSCRVRQAREARIFDEPILIRAWAETKGLAFGAICKFCVGKSDTGHSVQIPFCSMPPRISNLMTRRMRSVGEPHFDFQNPLIVGDYATCPSIWPALAAELQTKNFCEQATIMRITESFSEPDLAEDDAKTSPMIVLEDFHNWEDYLNSRPQKHRTDVRRQIRRLSEQGPLRLSVFGARDQREASAELLRLRDAYEKLWKGSPSEGVFQAPGTWDFYQRMITDLLPTGQLHFSVLYVGSQAVAWHFGFLHRGVLHWYKPTYQREWEEYSPGKVLLAMLIQLGFESKWKEFDFGCGAESYKLRWTDKFRRLFRWNWKSTSLRSRLGESTRHFIRSLRCKSNDSAS